MTQSINPAQRPSKPIYATTRSVKAGMTNPDGTMSTETCQALNIKLYRDDKEIANVDFDEQGHLDLTLSTTEAIAQKPWTIRHTMCWLHEPASRTPLRDPNKEYTALEDDKDRDSDGVCLCGNLAHRGGFWPCDEHGNGVTIDAGGPWHIPLDVCAACGRIINQDCVFHAKAATDSR
jgi:hypothetical protein